MCLTWSTHIAALGWPQAAEGLLSSQPDVLLTRVVRHVQRVLEVPTLDGLLPALSAWSLRHAEMANALKAVASLLGLASDASEDLAHFLH